MDLIFYNGNVVTMDDQDTICQAVAIEGNKIKRENQIQRAVDVIEKNPAKIKKSGSNDFKRFIEKTSVTTDGEVAEKELFSSRINLSKILLSIIITRSFL